MRITRLTLLAAAGITLAAPPRARAADVVFHITDERDSEEISEDTVVFINGRQVARFVLDQAHNAGDITVRLPSAPAYDYALCGRIAIHRADGSVEQRVIDGGATLHAPDGHSFRALAASDFTVFYLVDARAEPPEPPADVHRSDACSLPVS